MTLIEILPKTDQDTPLSIYTKNTVRPHFQI